MVVCWQEAKAYLLIQRFSVARSLGLASNRLFVLARRQLLLRKLRLAWRQVSVVDQAWLLENWAG